MKRFSIQLDKTTSIAINKSGDNINLYICQDQTCIKLNRDLILMLLSLKSVIEETICHVLHTTELQKITI